MARTPKWREQAPFPKPPGQARISEALGFAFKCIVVPTLFIASAGAVFYGAVLIAFEQPMGKLLGLAVIAASFLVWNIGWRVRWDDSPNGSHRVAKPAWRVMMSAIGKVSLGRDDDK